MHLILTGATGLVGSAVLDGMVRMKDVTKISIVSRRPVKMADELKDPRINVILHKDFQNYDESLLSQVKGATGCVWALGVSQNAVGKEEYVKITKDFTLSAAEAFQTLGTEAQPFHFVCVSGEGATHHPGLFTPIYGRVKGETEIALAAMRSPEFVPTSVRPGFVDWAGHESIKPYLPALPAWRAALTPILAPPIRAFYKAGWTPTEPMSSFMTEMAMGRWEGRFEGSGVEKVGEGTILGNVAFRRLAGLDKK